MNRSRSPVNFICALLSGGLVLATLGACGSSSNSTALSATEFAFLAGGGVVAQSQQYLFTATQQLTRRCMTSRGFQYLPAQLAAPPKHTEAGDELTADGKAPNEAAQLEQRERIGYGIYEAFAPSSSGEEGAQPAPNDAYVRSLTPAQQASYMRTLEGDPSQRATATPPGGPSYSYVTGGCLGRVDTELYGSPSIANSIINTPQAIRQQIVTSTEGDPAVVAAKLKWTRCMRERTGKQFAAPPAVESWLSQAYSGGHPAATLRKLEIMLATSDTRCAYSTGLAQTYAATFRRQANHLTPTLQGTLVSMLEHEKTATRRAQTILAAGR